LFNSTSSSCGIPDPDRFLDLLAEPNVARRVAARDRVDALLAELDGRADL
jgi:hypothetical protein